MTNPIDYDELTNEATKLFSLLRTAQAKMPDNSIQRKETGSLAHAIDSWCRFVEENHSYWSTKPRRSR